MEAEIVICYDDDRIAETVARAVSPDNIKVPHGLFVQTSRRGHKVATFIKCRKGFSTFIATIDDLLFSTSIAEKTVRILKKML